MEKNKIAESIIIRVGGGIREVYREPLDAQDAKEPVPDESAAEKPGAAQIFESEFEPPSTIS